MTHTLRDRGHLVGALMLAQLTGLILPFVLLLPIATPATEWLHVAAQSAPRITTGVLLLVANGAVTITISVLTWPTLRTTGGRGQVLLVLAALWLGMQLVDNVHILAMLTLSQSASPRSDPLVAATVIGALRRWAHVSALLAIDAWILCFYGNLIRAGAVHRAVGAFGLVTASAHLLAIPLPSLLGFQPLAVAGMPMALSHVVTAVWLWRHGFRGSAVTVRPGSL